MKTISNFCKRLALEAIAEEIDDRRIEVFEMPSYGEPIQLGVNWAAIGTVSAEEAVAFAAKLTKAAEIAANHPMNGAEIVYK